MFKQECCFINAKLETAVGAIKEQAILLLTSPTYRKKNQRVIQIHFTVERSACYISKQSNIEKRDLKTFCFFRWSQYLKDYGFMTKRKI